MAAESYYFSHDYGARNDPKLQKVLQKLGHAGKGVYWDIIEMLHEEGGRLLITEIDNYAFALRAECDIINRLINEFDLFKKDDLFFWSESATRRLNRRSEKSKKAQKSAQIRWDNDANAYNNNAFASKNDAIKEKKGKEKKGKERKESSLPVFSDLFSFFKGKNIWSVEICDAEAQKFMNWIIAKQIENLPAWKANAETWIIRYFEFNNEKKINGSSMPGVWDEKYAGTLDGPAYSKYIAHLHGLGLRPVRNRFEKIIDFQKIQIETSKELLIPTANNIGKE